MIVKPSALLPSVAPASGGDRLASAMTQARIAATRRAGGRSPGGERLERLADGLVASRGERS